MLTLEFLIVEEFLLSFTNIKVLVELKYLHLPGIASLHFGQTSLANGYRDLLLTLCLNSS